MSVRTRGCAGIAFLLLLSASAAAQDANEPQPGFLEKAKSVYETLFTRPFRLSLEPIAPTSGLVIGIGYKPKPWRSPRFLKEPVARAAVSGNKYWAVDGSVGFQRIAGAHEWRIEPYARARSMKRLNDFGNGNDTLESSRSNFAFLDRRAGAYWYFRPAGWLAIGGRGEGFWLRTDSGQNPDLPSVENRLPADQIPGFRESTNYVYAAGFVNLNYPYVRSERPRRGGDYMITVGRYGDVSDTKHSFNRVEVEGQERFPLLGVDRLLTVHGRLSSSFTGSGNSVPFYLMDTLGGADNLRGFKESVIGGDETTSTLRSFESFRFRDLAMALVQMELRQRVWSQLFASVFFDAGTVASSIRNLPSQRVHRGVGVGLSVYRTNALMIRAEFSVWGGEGHPHYLTTGRGLQF